MVKQQRAFAKVAPHLEGVSQSPYASQVKVDDKNAAKDSSSPGSSIQPAQLSSKVTSMRVMIVDPRKAQELSYAAKTSEDVTAATGGEEVALNTILRSEEGNPLIRYCPGRRSFGDGGIRRHADQRFQKDGQGVRGCYQEGLLAAKSLEMLTLL
eukprot:766155-Hanusia_phi.AAC.2